MVNTFVEPLAVLDWLAVRPNAHTGEVAHAFGIEGGTAAWILQTLEYGPFKVRRGFHPILSAGGQRRGSHTYWYIDYDALVSFETSPQPATAGAFPAAIDSSDSVGGRRP